MDQALLRYRRDGRRYHPHVVLFGLQLENMKRNVNLFRFFLYPSRAVPFSKPRFVLEDGRLRLVNSPTLAPERIMATLEDFARSPLAPYETFFEPGDYHMAFYQHSRLLASAADLWRMRVGRPNPETAHGDSMDLTLAIVRAFAAEARQDGALFLMPYLPQADEMGRLHHGRGTDAPLLERIRAQEPVLMPGPLLDKAASDGPTALCVDGISHYTAMGNRLVAHAVADALISQTSQTVRH
jgi:hypothetical protein